MLKGLRSYFRSVRCLSSNESPLKRLLNESATYQDKEIEDPELHFATLPYPRIPNDEPGKQKIDPRHTSIILFPGQGSHYLGMATNLMKFPQSKELFNMGSDILKFDLLRVCQDGPIETLNEHCQVCIMVTSLATLEQLKEERPSAIEQCAATAGFSLGEITALVFAGALDFAQAIRLVQIRATAMEAAAKEQPSGMLTVMFGPDCNINYAILRAKQYCKDSFNIDVQCQIANYMYPHCKVIAGSKLALEYLEKNGKEFGIRRTQRVKVSGGFHTELMRAAVEPFKKALSLCDVKTPCIPVVSNIDAKPYRDAKHIKQQLPKQIIKAVRWEQTLHKLFSRDSNTAYPQVFTIGPGSSLRTILRQVNAKAYDSSLNIDSS